MTIFDSIILGVIEGFTEFLPISSTGHLIVASEFLNLEQTNFLKAYEVIIQFAAILAVVLTYPSKFSLKHIELWKKLILSFIPIGIVGFLFASSVKELFDVKIVGIMFIVGGIIFLIVEYFYRPKKNLIDDVEKVSYKQALYIGLYQITALVPGTSRAGATIIGAMLVGLDRKTSAEFSFLLAIPVMSITTGYDLINNYQYFMGSNLQILIIGFIIAFVVAYITIKLFLKFLENFTFVAFGIYRILFGAVLLIFFI